MRHHALSPLKCCKMIVLSHPTGNQFARSVLSALYEHNLLDSFHTTLAISEQKWMNILPASIKAELLRREYDVPREKLHSYPLRELARLVADKLNVDFVSTHETGWASVDSIYQEVDSKVAEYVRQQRGEGTTPGGISGVYCYEDGAL